MKNIEKRELRMMPYGCNKKIQNNMLDFVDSSWEALPFLSTG